MKPDTKLETPDYELVPPEVSNLPRGGRDAIAAAIALLATQISNKK